MVKAEDKSTRKNGRKCRFGTKYQIQYQRWLCASLPADITVSKSCKC